MAKVFIAVTLSILIISVSPAYAQNQTQNQTQTQTQTPTEWETYNDPVLGISISYPKGWTTWEEPYILNLEGNQTIPLVNGTVTLLSCYVLVTPSEVNNSTLAMLSYLNSRRGEIEVKSFDDSLDINGLPAYRIYHNDSNSDPTVDYTIVDDVNKMHYSLVCKNGDEKVFNQYSPVFEEIVKSLKIL